MSGRGDPVVVLVVEDDEAFRFALERILRDELTRVLTSSNALHALTTLESTHVDVVIADQVMPGMDGVTLLETVRDRWPDIRRVLLTGMPGPDVVIDSVNRAGVHKVLTKPVDPEVIVAVVNDCLADR